MYVIYAVVFSSRKVFLGYCENASIADNIIKSANRFLTFLREAYGKDVEAASASFTEQQKNLHKLQEKDPQVICEAAFLPDISTWAEQNPFSIS